MNGTAAVAEIQQMKRGQMPESRGGGGGGSSSGSRPSKMVLGLIPISTAAAASSMSASESS